MSSKSRASVAPVAIDYSDIHWSHADNLRRPASYGDPLSDLAFKIEKDEHGDEVPKGLTQDGLVFQMSSGWNASVQCCNVFHLTKEQQHQAVKERKEQIEAWRKRPATVGLAVTAERLWTKPPTYGGNDCYRRSIAIMGVLQRRIDADDKAKLDYTVWSVVNEYGSEEERVLQHVGENTLKDAGRRDLDILDYVGIAQHLDKIKGAKAKESDLVKAGVKRGMAIAAFAIAKLDKQFPEVKLVARATLPSTDPQYIPLRRFRHNELQRLRAGYKHNSKGDEPSVQLHKTKGLLNVKDVQAYVKEKIAGTSATTFTIKEVREALVESPILLCQAIGRAIGTGNVHFLETFNQMAEVINDKLKSLADQFQGTDDDDNSDNSDE